MTELINFIYSSTWTNRRGPWGRGGSPSPESNTCWKWSLYKRTGP